MIVLELNMKYSKDEIFKDQTMIRNDLMKVAIKKEISLNKLSKIIGLSPSVISDFLKKDKELCFRSINIVIKFLEGMECDDIKG